MMDNFTMQGHSFNNNVAPNQQQQQVPNMLQSQQQQQLQSQQIQQPQQQPTFPGIFNSFLTSPLMFQNLTQNGTIPMFYDPAQIQNSILMMNGYQVPQQTSPIMNHGIVIPTNVQPYQSPMLFQTPQQQPIQQLLQQPQPQSVQLLHQEQQQVQSPVTPPQHVPLQQVIQPKQQVQPQQHAPVTTSQVQPNISQPTPQPNAATTTTSTTTQSKPSTTQLQPQTTPVAQKPKQEQPKQEDETKIKIPKIKKPTFEAKLNELKDSRGGINKVESVAAFIKLMDEEKAQKNRPLLLAALNVSSKNCQEKFIELNGVKILVSWLKETSEKNKPKLMIQILNILSKLPMTVDCLKTSEVGKMVKILLKTHQSNEQLKTRMESLMRQWRRLAEKKDISAMPPVPKKSKEVKSSDSDSGIFSMISGTSIPKKSSNQAHTSASKPKPAATNASSDAANRRTQQLKVETTDKKVVSSSSGTQQQKPTPSKSSPQKRKAEDSPSDEQAVKRARTSSPPTTSATTTATSSKKKRVRWAENLEHIKLFEKEIPIDGPEVLDQEQQQHQQHAPHQQHSYNQDRLNEKMFFAQQREEKRKRLEAMNATIQWYQPSPLSGIAMFERGKKSEEAAIRSAEHLKRQPVIYHHPQDIPSTPASPQRDISLNTALLKNLVSALSANKQPTSASSNPPNINNFTTQQHHNQPQQNFAQMHPHGNVYHSDHGRNMAQPPYQQQQQPYFEQPLLQQRAAAYQNGVPPVNISAVTSASIKPSKSIRCKFFETKVGCRNGANCPFYHAGIDPIPVGGVKEFDPEIAKQLQQSRMAKQQQRTPSSNNNNNNRSGNNYR